jgi:hypothetical protein
LKTVPESPSNPKLQYAWQQTVVDAFMEFHADRLRDKITAAERAVSERLRQRPTSLEEQLALHDALSALKALLPELKHKIQDDDKEKSA